MTSAVHVQELTAIVTTAPSEGLGSGAGLADLSYNRWPCQEATFKEMTRYCNLKVNHGFKKCAVFNRMAANKLENAEKSLNHVISRINSMQEKLEGVKRKMEKSRTQWEKNSKKLTSQIETIHHNIREQRGDEIKFKLWR